jgi:AcrR family transcriptional regulator
VPCASRDGSDEPPRLPLWAREDGTSSGSPLSRDVLVGAAVDLADREGLDAVSMRRMGEVLDTRVMSLYRFVASKDDLLELMFDEVARRALVDSLSGDWARDVRAIAAAMRHAFRDHPWNVDLFRGQATLGPHTLRLLDRFLEAVGPLGLPAARAWTAITVLMDYVRGYLVRDAAMRRLPSVDTVGVERAAAWHRDVNAYLAATAASGDLPHLAPLLDHGFDQQPDTFDEGLDWIISAIARGAGTSTPAPTP